MKRPSLTMEEFDWGDEADIPIPEGIGKPLTQTEVEFWFEELYDDGTPIPPHKLKVN